MKADYTRDVEIDQNNLDVEWKRQPKLVLHWSEMRADAARDVDEAKEALEILIAEKDMEIRDSADKKPTESAIANMIKMDKDVQDAQQTLTEARHSLAKLQAACSAFDHKKAALENLVKLFGMSYFAEPSADLVSRGKLADMAEKGAKDKIEQRMNRAKDTCPDDAPLPERKPRR